MISLASSVYHPGVLMRRKVKCKGLIHGFECPPETSVLHQVNVFNDNILSLRKNIRKSEVEVNKINVKKPNYSEYEIVLYDQIEEMYVAISDLKNKICEIKHGQCVCFSDASSGPCKLYDV